MKMGKPASNTLTFTGGDDVLYSFSNVVINQGKLYGTTKYVGTKNKGVVFEVTP